MNALARFSAIMNPQNLIMIVSLIIRCIMRLLAFQCSAAVAEAAVPRLEESVVCTAAAVVEAGTAMLAMMSTLAAVMVIETDEASTPALSAIWRLSSSRRWSV